MARFGVPYFFAISGYLFCKKLLAEPVLPYTKKFLIRIIKIYILTTILYLGSYWILYKLGVSNKVDLAEFSIISLLYYGPYHLWFLTGLFYSALIGSLFFYINALPVLLAISGLLFGLGLFGQSYQVLWHFEMQTRDALFFALFFTTLGMFMATLRSTPLQCLRTHWITVLFFISLLLQVLEAYVLREMGASPGNYYLSTAFCTFFLLLWVISCPELGKSSAIVDVGQKTLGIFLIHPFLMKIFSALLDGNIEFETNIAWQIVYPFLVLLVSYGVIKIYFFFVPRLKILL